MTSAGAEVGAEEVVDGAEQVLDVVAGRRRVVDVAVVVVVGGADQRLAVPGQDEDRAVGARGDDARRPRQRELLRREGHVRAAAGRDPRHLGLVVDLLGPDPVGPHAGGVDHVVGLDLELLARLGVAAADPGRDPALVAQTRDLGAVEAHGAEALGLAEDRQHQPDVVGLAVVEEVGLARLERLERRDQLERLVRGDRPVAVGRPVVAGPLALLAVAACLADPRGRHHVVHVQPDAEHPRPLVLAHASAPGTASDRRGAGRAGPAAGARAAPRAPARGRSSAGSEGRRAPSSTSGWRCRSPSRSRSTIGHGVAARRRVEGGAGAGDPAADDDHVEALALDGLERPLAGQHRALTPGTPPPRPPARARAGGAPGPALPR